ncbi:MAG: hypothetical protein GY756_09735 [bacterium]|nr:hypothetical protein [bacterium]
MKQLISIFITILAFSMPIYSQWGASVEIGIGSYSMKELKKFNKDNIELQSEYNINLEQLENFPVYPNFSFEIFYERNRSFRYGLGYQYLSTGSRLYYGDYSGNYSMDILTSANAIQFKVSNTISKRYFDIGLYCYPQLLFCNTEFKSTLNLEPDFAEKDDLTVHAIDFGASWGVILRKNIGKLEIDLKAGYFLDIFKGKMKEKMFDREPIMNEKIKNNWSGFRISLGLGYYFKEKEQEIQFDFD